MQIVAAETSLRLLAPLSLAIAAATWSASSHFRFVLDDGRILDAAYPQGVTVRQRPVHRGEYVRRYDLTRMFTADALAEMTTRAMLLRGRCYDLPGAFGYLVNDRQLQKPDRYYCFEFGAEVLAPFITLPRNIERVAGRHLHKILKPCRVRPA